MPYNQERVNIRNYMVGLTLPEAREFRDEAVVDGRASVAEYAAEFVCEYEAEEADYEG